MIEEHGPPVPPLSPPVCSLYMQDPADLTIYYESYYRPPSLLYLPFNSLNLSAGAPPMVANVAWLPPDVTGDATPLLRPAPAPFDILVGAMPPPCSGG